MQTRLKYALLGAALTFASGILLNTNLALKEWIGLKIVRLTAGMEVQPVRSFADRPRQLYVPSAALTTKGSRGSVYVLRGPVLSEHNEFVTAGDLGEIREGWTELKNGNLMPEDRVVIFHREPASL